MIYLLRKVNIEKTQNKLELIRTKFCTWIVVLFTEILIYAQVKTILVTNGYCSTIINYRHFPISQLKSSLNMKPHFYSWLINLFLYSYLSDQAIIKCSALALIQHQDTNDGSRKRNRSSCHDHAERLSAPLRHRNLSLYGRSTGEAL